MISNYLGAFFIQSIFLALVSYASIRALRWDIENFLPVFLSLLTLALSAPALFSFKNIQRQNRNKKKDYFFIVFYCLLLVVILTTFSALLSKSPATKDETSNEDLYFINRNILNSVLSENLGSKETILKLERLSELYPLDIDVYKTLFQEKRKQYFKTRPELSSTINALEEQIKLSKKEEDSENLARHVRQLLDILPRQKEFEPLKKKYSEIIFPLEKEKNQTPSKKSHPSSPIQKFLSLLENDSTAKAIFMGASLFPEYCENENFQKIYKENLRNSSFNEFYPEGFLKRAEMEGIQKKASSPLFFEGGNHKTLNLSNFIFFNNIVLSKNVAVKDGSNPFSSEKIYPLAVVQNEVVFLKPKFGEASEILYSEEVDSFLKNYPLIASESFQDLLKHDVVSLTKAVSLIKKYNPSIYPYIHVVFSLYSNIFFINITLLLIFLYFSYHIVRSKFNLLFSLFGLFFSLLLYAAKFYFVLILFYLSTHEYLRFYLFDNLVNLLMLFLAIALYSNTNPKTNSENAYALYENTFERKR